jgi:hypothetical protein
MSITVATHPKATQLTTLATVKAELGVDTTTDDALMTVLIDQISGVFETLCNRPFYRAQFIEEVAAIKPISPRMVLSRLPVLELDEIIYYGDTQTLSEFSIENPEAGFIYRVYGFGRMTSSTDWSFKFKAGYLLPGDDFAGDTITVDSATDTYTDSASGFPPALVPGDTFVASGFGDTTNDGRKTVVTASPSAISVAEGLADEAPGATVAMAFRNLPQAVERACIDNVKLNYQTRKNDPTLISLTVGPVSAKQWATGGGKDSGSKYTLPPELNKYRIHMRG